MADTTRQSILAGIKVILDGVEGISYTEINKVSPVDLETISYPCAFIYPDVETKLSDSRAVIGYENWEWMISIEVWAGKDTNLETLLGEIHTAMVNDYRIGGNAVTSDRIGSEFFLVDPVREIQSMILSYSIIYRHRKGVP